VQALFNGPTVGASLNGTTVTAGSGGNSGGGDSWFFDTVQIGATGSLIFDNAHVTHNVEAFRFTTGGTAGNCNVQWQGSITAAATMWFRIYIFTPSSFALTPTIVRMLDSTGATQACRIAWNASGNILIRDSGNVTRATSTNAMSVSTAYRLEGFCTQGASGTAEIKFWSSIDSSGSPVETLTAAAQNYGTNNIGNVAFGQMAAIANMPSWWGSAIAVTDGGYLGPWQPPLSPVAARHRVYAVQRRAAPVSVPPSQATAPVVVRPTRRTPTQRPRAQITRVPPAQPPASPIARPARRMPTLRRRARGAGIPQAQAAPVAPTYVPLPVHHLLRLVVRMRGESTQTPIAQTVPLAPPYVAPPSRRLPRLLSAWTRGRRTSTPIAQTVPPPPVIAPQPVLRVRRLLPLLTRRRPVVVPLAQVKAPVPIPRRRLRLPVLASRHSVVVPLAQVKAPVPTQRRRLPLPLLGRRRPVAVPLPQAAVPVPTSRRRLWLPPRRPGVARVTPPQVVAVAPQCPPQPWRRRLLAALFGPRRGAEVALSSAAVQVCETPRPSTGVTARPSSGTTAYAAAMTARPSTGDTTRPDSGTTEDPC
jgi:hypothetical protein